MTAAVRKTCILGFAGTCLCLSLLISAYLLLMASSDFAQPEDEHYREQWPWPGSSKSRALDVFARPRPCQEKHSFVYIKMIKCASETLCNIFRRFGRSRDLNFVLPVGNRIYLGWPYPFEESFYRPLHQEGSFNILCDHAVFNKEKFQQLMPNDTAYLTSLREPYSQFKSMFHYYKLQKLAQVPGDDPVTEYLHNVRTYEAKYKSPEVKSRYCIPDGFSMSKNLMSFNLGFPTGSFDGTPDLSFSKDLIAMWLQDLEKHFDLVLIIEYFTESLVLLRRVMCWDLKDLLHRNLNVGAYKYRHLQNNENIQVYREWSRVDFALYEHFNATLWKKIQKAGSDFWEEVSHFRLLLREVEQFCGAEYAQTLKVAKSEWNSAFTFTKESCDLLNKHQLRELQERDDLAQDQRLEPEPSKKYC